MPFEVTNTLVVFQHMMNDVFEKFLDDFVVISIDNILIYSIKKENHKNMFAWY